MTHAWAMVVATQVASIFVIAQSGLVTGLLGAVITTIEKRYGISSVRSGLIFSAYDVAVLAVVTPISYYGGL